jgi:hypothetical protein
LPLLRFAIKPPILFAVCTTLQVGGQMAISTYARQNPSYGAYLGLFL